MIGRRAGALPPPACRTGHDGLPVPASGVNSLQPIPSFRDFFGAAGQVYKLSIGAACALEWPAERVVVQVLDDSTDPVVKVPTAGGAHGRRPAAAILSIDSILPPHARTRTRHTTHSAALLLAVPVPNWSYILDFFFPFCILQRPNHAHARRNKLRHGSLRTFFFWFLPCASRFVEKNTASAHGVERLRVETTRRRGALRPSPSPAAV